MREALLVGANLILTFHDVNTLRFEDTVSFLRSFEVQVEDGIVIFLRRVLRAVVVIVVLEVLVILMRCAAGRVHVRRIKYHTIERGVAVGQLAAIHACPQVAGSQGIRAFGHLFPKHALAVGDIGDQASFGHIELQNVREHLVVGRLIG